jgi:hypothetical protein
MYYLSLDGSVGIVTGGKNLDQILRSCPMKLTENAFIKVAQDEFDHIDLELKYEQGLWHRKERNQIEPRRASGPDTLNMKLKV